MPRVLGLDYGERRLGFALSDELGTLATPLCVVSVRDPGDCVREVLRVLKETGAGQLVVGLPLNMDGTRGPAARNVLALVERLREAGAGAVATWDERLTTSQAQRVLLEADTSRAKRKRVIDKLAAQLMLQSYLDAACAGPG